MSAAASQPQATVREVLRLRCPECGSLNTIPRRKLAVGYLLYCLHCGADLFLDRVYREPRVQPQWLLATRDADGDRAYGQS